MQEELLKAGKMCKWWKCLPMGGFISANRLCWQHFGHCGGCLGLSMETKCHQQRRNKQEKLLYDQFSWLFLSAANRNKDKQEPLLLLHPSSISTPGLTWTSIFNLTCFASLVLEPMHEPPSTKGNYTECGSEEGQVCHLSSWRLSSTTISGALKSDSKFVLCVCVCAFFQPSDFRDLWEKARDNHIPAWQYFKSTARDELKKKCHE